MAVMEDKPERVEQISDTVANIQNSISIINKELAALRTTSAKADRPWYREPSFIIALTALLFSFGTTAVSYIRTNQQDIHDARAELRSLILRLTQLPRESIEYSKKYEKEPLIVGGILGMLNTENALVAKQAANIMSRIPGNISATEYLSVSSALVNSGLTETAMKLIKLALAVSNDVNDEVGVLRSYGGLLFSTGDLEGGREKFKTALMIFSKYPITNQYYVETTHALTEMYWAQFEAAARQCPYAKSHMAQANSHLSVLPPGSYESIKGQVDQVQKVVDSCNP
jgi:hypothetical protein